MKNSFVTSLAVAVTALAVGCGGGEQELARVDGTKIDRAEVESLVALYRRRGESEGEGEQAEKTSHAQEVATLQLLVQRAILDTKAKELGIHVDEDAVARRAEALRGRESEARAEEDEREQHELDDQFRDTARAQFVYEALYRRLTGDLRVGRGKVLAYYRSHLSSYSRPGKPAPRTPSPLVAASIARGLTAIERNEAFAAWLKRVQRQFAAKVEYRKGWAPAAAR
jgi:hypothetical protein